MKFAAWKAVGLSVMPRSSGGPWARAAIPVQTVCVTGMYSAKNG